MDGDKMDACTSKRESRVTAVVEELNEEMSMVTDTVSRACDRFATCCDGPRPEDEKANVRENPYSTVPLADQLHGLLCRMRCARVELVDLIERCEL